MKDGCGVLALYVEVNGRIKVIVTHLDQRRVVGMRAARAGGGDWILIV